MMTLRRNFAWVLAIAGGICLGAAVGFTQSQTDEGLAPPPLRSPQELSNSFRDVAQRALPAIVSIETETNPRPLAGVEGGGRRQSPLDDEMFRRFFGEDPRFEQFFNAPRMMPRQQGAGSGFLVDKRGIILTNSHVVENADRVTVTLHDGREFEAESWNFDPRSDVAIVRINAGEDLPFLALGNSDQMQIGDWVLALGNPLNVGVSVTAGIISATGRGPGINEREQYLQTDAAINPGNSGGPLVNLFGDVVGINTAISTRSGGYDGVGFAIPSNNARWVADQLIQDGEVHRSYLGVQLQELSNEIRSQLGLDRRDGALVVDVFPDTPAAKAKIQAGDIVLQFAGETVANRDALVDLVERSAPNKDYKAVVLREGEEVTLTVRLEPMPQDYTAALRRARGRDIEEEETQTSEHIEVSKFGFEVAELTKDVAEQLGIDQSLQGVIVQSVSDGGAAQRAGLEIGDVIQRIGTRPVRNLNDFRATIDRTDLSRGLLLHVRRDESSAFIVLKPSE
ncbi:MAG: Do family serine endopeptidase [Planctomycetaceae bacterium]|nr:Do family serine endopeptidase [Planctomycetaceae bacterium]